MNNTGKWLFYDHFWPFVANCMAIFHKTEVQTVILMCLIGQNLNWLVRDHPFKTSACSRGGGVKNLPNLPTDSTKKLPTVGG